MKLKLEFDGESRTHSVNVVEVGNTVEIFNQSEGLWAGLHLSEDEMLELRNTLWWSLYHSGTVTTRPTEVPE